MLLGMGTGLHHDISLQDIGLSGITEADGLAVGRPSGFVGKMMEPLLDGEFTIQDEKLYEFLRDLEETETVFLESSACAAFQGAVKIENIPETVEYLEENNFMGRMAAASHIVWATGGSLVPEDVRVDYRKMFCCV